MNKKTSSKEEPKEEVSTEATDCCQGGYGYMKRRLGLLSHEADKLKENRLKPDTKKE